MIYGAIWRLSRSDLHWPVICAFRAYQCHVMQVGAWIGKLCQTGVGRQHLARTMTVGYGPTSRCIAYKLAVDTKLVQPCITMGAMRLPVRSKVTA